MLKKAIGNLRVLKKWYDLRFKGYLYNEGWFVSIRTQESVSKDNKPVIWMTYPFLDFMEERITAEMSVFEYGSGNSTLYLEEKVRKIISVEHDKSWHDHIINKSNGRAVLLYRNIESQNDYIHSINEVDQLFDILIVDGRLRNKCIEYSKPFLKDHGIVILDDAERSEYKNAHDYMKTQGFKKIEFKGMAPGILYKKSTCVFYRNKNCLGI